MIWPFKTEKRETYEQRRTREHEEAVARQENAREAYRSTWPQDRICRYNTFWEFLGRPCPLCGHALQAHRPAQAAPECWFCVEEARR